jgi:polysaccharide pyruvyl transferase CsaB
MKIVLFDDIHETHVRRSFARALRKRGHVVVETPPIWRGHRLPSEPNDIQHIREAVDSVLEAKPDVLFNFRASSLTPGILSDVRRAGITTAVWFPDDPVLYSVCYRHVVEHYDIVLNCGSREIIDFYEKQHNVFGFNFPFWTDREEFPHTYDSSRDFEFDVAFLGTFKGPARASRYETLASLPFRVKAFGEIKDDPAQISGGYLKTPLEVADAISKGKIGFNMPQIFSDYRGHPYDFPELARLGSFEFASRVIQYMAVGLPVATLGRYRPPPTFPEMLVAPDTISMNEVLRTALSNPDKLRELSAATAARFETAFSADARAILFETLCTQPGLGQKLASQERSNVFANVNNLTAGGGTAQSPSNAPDDLPSIAEQKERLSKQNIEAKNKYDILHIGTFTQGSTDVVACLHRSLLNLGHNVHHIDIREDIDILVEPGGAISGYGPVLVNHMEVLRLAKEYQAQIIICNAAGLCFTPQAAEQLKQAGLILIGITLSDPDVQDSILGHVENFDLHFTNSRHALKRYEELGIKNTFYLPFAVDLGWIFTEVPSDPKFHADIICLGHAVNRPDRLEAMQAVWDNFSNVRTYGKGWPFPGSGDVRGQDLLQASRGGRLHINFPLTRAGFINVKCGVFETVGSGGVLLTGIFPEMGELFEYDTEIVGYNSTEELISKIRSLLANPDEVERIRRRAFARLVSSHLYEHRWITVFDKLEAALSGAIGIFDEERRSKLDRELRRHEKRKVQVGITGFYGHGNLGDELILSSLLTRARDIRPDLQFTVFTNSPARVQRDFGLRAIRLDDDNAITKLLGRMDATILGGGGLWHDYTFERAGGPMALFKPSKMSMGGYARPSFMIAATGAQFHVYGLGVGPLKSSTAREFAKFMSRQINTITVRDPGSAELLQSIPGWEKEVRVAPDMVYAHPLDTEEAVPEIDEIAGSLPVMLINLRPWSGADMERFLDQLASAISKVLKDKPHALIGLPMQEGPSHDYSALTALFERIDEPVPRRIIDWEGNPQIAIAAIRRADAVIAMRLHACLLAHRLEVPTLGLAYDPKLTAHFAELDRSRYCLPLSATAASIEQEVRHLLTDDGQLTADQRKFLRELEARAKHDLEWLLTQLPDAPRSRSIAQISAAGEKDVDTAARRSDHAEIRLGRVQVTGQSFGRGAPPPVETAQLSPTGIRFHIDESAPQAGSAAVFSMRLRPRQKTANAFQLTLRSTYSRVKNVGYLSFIVLLDGKMLAREQFGYSNAENVLSVYVGAPLTGKQLEVRIVADKDCPDWNWNRAVALEVLSLEYMVSPVSSGLIVTSSSPWTETATQWLGSRIRKRKHGVTSIWSRLRKRVTWDLRNGLRN